MKTPDEPTLAEQRERLNELRRWEQKLRSLRARRNELEIECIAGDVAMRRTPGHRAPIDVSLAVEVEAALNRCRRIKEQLVRAREGTRQEQDRLVVGRDALRLWLEAPQEERRARPGGRVKHVLFAVSLLAIIAAISVHVVFLVLLLPIAGASSFLSWSGQDDAWRRMGAKRKFVDTRLEAPGKWEEDTVRERLEEIEGQIGSLTARAPTKPADDLRTLEATLHSERTTLEVLLTGAGLDEDGLEPETERWIRTLGRASRSRRELTEMQAEISGLSRDIDEVREDLFRYLARRGSAGAEGRADTATLAAGLERLARVSHRAS